VAGCRVGSRRDWDHTIPQQLARYAEESCERGIFACDFVAIRLVNERGCPTAHGDKRAWDRVGCGTFGEALFDREKVATSGRVRRVCMAVRQLHGELLFSGLFYGRMRSALL
jgi:hypothetical protein